MNKYASETKEAKQISRPRKANECIVDPTQFFLPATLFDEFWRAGELALLFGAQGTGKSLLAVQIAEALTRGGGLDGFRMPTGRRKVLYVDLELQDVQFQMRYSQPTPSIWPLKSYRFAENLYRDRPASTGELCEWLRETVLENRFQVVIIDSLSAIKRTHDGTRETLTFMRGLRQLRDELNVSILVLTDSEEPAKGGIVREADLRRSRVLCSVADSVFAIGRHPHSVGDRYLIQTRSRSTPVFWNERNAPVCRITRLDTGLLGFRFDERFAPYMDEETRQLICRVRSMREGGATFRGIAAELGISKTRAATLDKKWTPAMDCGTRTAECGVRNEEEARSAECEMRNEGEMRSAECGVRNEGEMRSAECGVRSSYPKDVLAIPWAAGLGRRSVYDLKPGVDGYGREIFIESENEHTGKPSVWYQFDEKGNKVRHERGMFGVNTERLDASRYL